MQVAEFSQRLKTKDMALKIGGSTLNALAKAAYKPEFGAREVRRVVQDQLENPLVEGLVNGTLKEGQTYQVGHDAKEKICTFKAVK
jgi:ATP-dependent Clp protease ATP-binding subunit ClpC